jgi:hypothetical protein
MKIRSCDRFGLFRPNKALPIFNNPKNKWHFYPRVEPWALVSDTEHWGI